MATNDLTARLPKIEGLKVLSPMELNDIRLTDGLTVLTPEILERAARLSGGKSAAGPTAPA